MQTKVAGGAVHSARTCTNHMIHNGLSPTDSRVSNGSRINYFEPDIEGGVQPTITSRTSSQSLKAKMSQTSAGFGSIMSQTSSPIPETTPTLPRRLSNHSRGSGLVSQEDSAGSPRSRISRLSSRTADSLMAILPTPAKQFSSVLEQELERIEWAEALLQGDGSFKLNVFGGVVVLLNAIVFAVQTDCGGRDEDGHLTWTWPWFIVDSLFCIAYLFEIALRLRRFGCQWLCNPANAADVAIVSANVLDTWVLSMLSLDAISSNVSMLTILKLLRLIRLVRLMRLIKFFRAFYAVVVAFKHAMSSIVWIGALLAFGLFLVSLFTTNFIGHGATFANVNMGGLSANDRFGTLFRSMFSNFELMTLEGWSDTWRPIVEAEPLMFAYLVLFIMVFTFGLLNMIVAMVVEKTIFESKKLEEIDEAADYRRMRTAIERMVEAFEEADGNSDGKITLSEFEAAVEKSTVVREALEFLNLPLEDARGLFLMLDINRSGELTIDEFS